MRASQLDIETIVARTGVIAVREYPGLRNAIVWRARTGHLVAVLPGVYTVPAKVHDTRTRIAAVSHWDPDAVVTHEAAASITFWPNLPVPLVRCAVAHRRAPQPGFRFIREQIPPELIWRRGTVLLISPALTALDLAAATDGSCH